MPHAVREKLSKMTGLIMHGMVMVRFQCPRFFRLPPDQQ
jgi:hypothetical protein